MPEATFTEEIVFDLGDRFFDSLSDAIVNAKLSIHLETFIFEQDAIGEKILNLLFDAALRGVNVQILLDGIGSSNWTHLDAEKMRKKGIEIRFFNPLPWQKTFKKFWHSLTRQRIILGFYKFNSRNHRKICIIDKQILYAGSMNISACHSMRITGKHAWRDTAVRVKGPGLTSYQNAVEQTWSFRKKYARTTRRAKREYRRSLIEKLAHARDHIWITNPYFIPDRRLIRTLCETAERGVDVKMIFPHHSDSASVKFAVEGFYMQLLKAGVKIHEYLPSMIHAKILIVDQSVTIGSSNLDHRSLYYDLEADIALTYDSNIALVHEQFKNDLYRTREIKYKVWASRSLMQILCETFFMSFRRIL